MKRVPSFRGKWNYIHNHSEYRSIRAAAPMRLPPYFQGVEGFNKRRCSANSSAAGNSTISCLLCFLKEYRLSNMELRVMKVIPLPESFSIRHSVFDIQYCLFVAPMVPTCFSYWPNSYP
jgi:hypothetical protein